MPQTSVNLNQNKAIVGMLADAGRHYVESRDAAALPISYGVGVMRALGLGKSCKLPTNNQLVLTDNAGTFTAGSISTTLVHGSTPSTDVITTSWISSKDATLTAHAAAILAAIPDAYSCVYSASAHTITLVMSSEDIVTGVTTITGGAYDTATETPAVSTADTAANIEGVAVMDHNREQQLVTGLTQYAVNEPVNVLRQGNVYVTVEEAVTPDDSVYLRLVTSGAAIRGNFAKGAHSSQCVALTGFRFADSSDTNNVVKLEVNLPQ